MDNVWKEWRTEMEKKEKKKREEEDEKRENKWSREMMVGSALIRFINIHPSVCPSIHLSIYSSVYLCILRSLCLFLFPKFCLSACLSLSLFPTLCLSPSLSVSHFFSILSYTQSRSTVCIFLQSNNTIPCFVISPVNYPTLSTSRTPFSLYISSSSSFDYLLREKWSCLSHQGGSFTLGRC